MMYINGQAVAPVICTWDDITTPGYVTDGLMALYDSIKNTANGHINSPSSWVDLSGNERHLLSVYSNNIFTMDSNFFYQSSMEMRYSDSQAMDSVKTLEIVIRPRSNTNQMVLQLNRSKKGMYLIKSANSMQFNSGEYGFPINRTVRSSVSYDYDNDKCFVNGVEVAHNSSVDTWSSSYNYDILLQDYDSTAYDFRGEICSIRLYNRTLTTEEKAHNLAIDINRFGVEVE